MPRYLSKNPTDFAENKDGDILAIYGESKKPFADGSEYLGPNASKAGAGRGRQGGPTAMQADQNKAMMSAAERGAREEMDFDKMSRYSPDQSYKKGGNVSSASKRADGIAMKGKTRGTMVAMCGGGYMKGKK